MFGALPFVGLSRPALASAEVKPKGAVVVNGEDARRLDRLYDALRATWPVEAEAHREMRRKTARSRRLKLPYSFEGIGGQEHCVAEHARDRAAYEFRDAVLEVCGTPKPSRDRWAMFGLPLAIAVTTRAMYIVSATDQAEYHPDPDDTGMLELAVLEF